jgi:hypothetical protein
MAGMVGSRRGTKTVLLVGYLELQPDVAVSQASGSPGNVPP